MFNRVGLEVKRKTSGNQIPWTSNDPFPDYYLAGGTAATKARLYVTTEPSDSRVRIMNISPAFYNGIELDPGRYKLEVSKKGYKTRTRWVNIVSFRGLDLYVVLEKQASVSGAGTVGQTWREPVTGMEFVWVPKGCFQMGQTEAEKQYLIKDVGKEKYNKYYNDELPRHAVCLDGFWMAKYEVTNRI